jgi:CHAT domain-containing protein
VQAHPRTLYLQWATVSDSRILLFAVYAKEKRGSTNAHVWALDFPAKTVARDCGLWYRALTENTIAASVREQKLARALYTKLLAPVEQAGLLRSKRFDRLVFVTDGALLSVPLGALEGPNGTRLIERFPVSEAVSFHALTVPPFREQTAPFSLLCAAPVSNLHTRSEAEQIADMFAPAVLLQGKQATEQTVREKLATARILHFATHGVLHGERGLRSYLTLSPKSTASLQPVADKTQIEADSADLHNDGRLEAREILELPLCADLTVLSACDTAQGQTQGGEGLLGFAWAFRAAGCPSVVASLWRVDDQATAFLMAQFYRNLHHGKAKDVALQQALLTTRDAQHGRMFRPYYWAAFRLTGNTEPLRVPASKQMVQRSLVRRAPANTRTGTTVKTTKPR